MKPNSEFRSRLEFCSVSSNVACSYLQSGTRRESVDFSSSSSSSYPSSCSYLQSGARRESVDFGTMTGQDKGVMAGLRRMVGRKNRYNTKI